MRFRTLLLMVGLVLPGVGGELSAGAAGPTRNPEMIVHFTNGDRIHGSIVGIDAKKDVRLTNPGVKETMEFSTADVAKVLFAGGNSAPSNAAPVFLVKFVNNDELLGNVSVLDAENVVLDTWYAGSLRFPRRHVQSIRLLQTEPVLYEGPTGIEGWTVTDTKEGEETEAWRYRDGIFYATEAGAIARDLKLPSMASLDMDVGWRDFLQLTITLYTDSLSVYQLSRNVQGVNGAVINVAAPPQEGAGFYALQLNRNTVYLLTVKKDGQVINSPLDMVPGLELKNKVHVSLRINKEQKTITLLLDGLFVKSWKEPEEFAGQGTAVRFVQQGQALVNLSNIKVSQWDGTIESAPVPTPNLTKDFLQLRNEDNLSGKLEGIKAGNVSFTTSFGTLEIPVARVAQIELPIDPAVKIPPDPQAVRAYFNGRGFLSLRVEEWIDQRVTVSSANFGKATFNVAAFERLEFKPARTP